MTKKEFLEKWEAKRKELWHKRNHSSDHNYNLDAMRLDDMQNLCWQMIEDVKAVFGEMVP